MAEKFFRYLVLLIVLVFVLGVFAGVLGGVFYYTKLSSGLPKIEKISDYKPKAVTTILAEDGTVMAEVYEERRYPVKFEDIPKRVRDAFLSAEDANFYSHPGIDFISIIRAVWKNFEQKHTVQGASTITQQVVKSLLLSSEKTWERKAKEAILSYRLEKALSKNEILTIYLNQVFLGSGSYGVKAAARVHFHKELEELTIAEAAFLAGLPQRPSVLVSKQHRSLAIDRQHYVLDQMLKNQLISKVDFDNAKKEKTDIFPADETNFYHAPYFAAHVVKMLDEQLAHHFPGQSSINPGGFVVHTTCDLKATSFAEEALRKGLRLVDKRRGWRGILNKQTNNSQDPPKVADVRVLDLKPGVLYKAEVTGVDIKAKQFLVSLGSSAESAKGVIRVADSPWARRYIQKSGKDPVHEKFSSIALEQSVKKGDVIEVSLKEKSKPDPKAEAAKVTQSSAENVSAEQLWELDHEGRIIFQLDQSPEIEGAVVLANPLTGKIKVIIGGYDYSRSVFNRATQALRQPGSAFKPIIYTTAVDEKDLTGSSIVPDSPISLKAGNGKLWTPQNFDHEFLGPITLRTALQKSRNVVSVALLRRVGTRKVIEMARRFGITTPIPEEMSISLGTAEVRLIELTRAYGIFAAGGWLLDPIYFTGVETTDGKTILERRPHYREVVSEETAFIMAHIMKGVVERGTATAVKALGRPVAGKTGTTNEHMDAWFLGYTPEWVSGVWVGFDEKRDIGKMETGGKISAPIFLDYMKKFLEGTPVTDFMIPDGVIPVLVNIKSGHPTSSDDPQGFVEYFKSGTEPMLTEHSGEAAAEGDYLSSDEF